MHNLKKLKINKIFEKVKTEKVSGKANDFPQLRSGEYCIPLLTAGLQNQGLARFAKRDQCGTVLKNVLSISANGANSGAVFYQPFEFSILQDAYAVKPIGHEISSEEEGLFLAAALGKAIRENHDWMNKAGWTNIENDDVYLPAVVKTVPDWKFIAYSFGGGY